MLNVYLITVHYSQSLSALNETTIRVLSVSSKSVWTQRKERRDGRARRGTASNPQRVMAQRRVCPRSAPAGVNKMRRRQAPPFVTSRIMGADIGTFSIRTHPARTHAQARTIKHPPTTPSATCRHSSGIVRNPLAGDSSQNDRDDRRDT